MSDQMAISTCPEESVLADYLTGRIEESIAASLDEHFETCPDCQRRLDSMTSNQGDSLFDAFRETTLRRADDSPELARLIEHAGQLDAASDAHSEPFGEPVELETFITCLNKSGLLDSGSVETLLEEIQPADTRSFAEELTRLNKLTPFQARTLTAGHWEGLVLGSYTVLEKLGEGGMGTVFKARHRGLGRVDCLKVMHSAVRRSPEQIERFRREIKTIGSLRHNNIVVAYGAEESDGIPFLAMEFIDGSDLARLVQQYGPMDVDDAVRIILQASKALDYAHQQGVTHRDIKPHNLMLDESGTVKILDMGLARLDTYLNDNADIITQATMTTSGVIMGTVDYMSPEQAMNSRKADARSDVYSLGCTLYYLITGRVLYDGETVMEKLIAHRESAIPELTYVCHDADTRLDAIFQRMVATDPHDRYATMAMLADDLELYLSGARPNAWIEQVSLPTDDQSFESLKVKPSLVGRSLLAVAAIVFGLVGGLAIAKWPDLMASLPNTAPSADNETPVASGSLAEGGKGRVLAVLPHEQFNDGHLKAILSKAQSAGIEVITASSRSGEAMPEFRLLKPVRVDRTIHDPFDSRRFDAVLFLDGNAVHEFGHKSRILKHSQKMIQQMLNQGGVVAATGEGQSVLVDAGFSVQNATIVEEQKFDGVTVSRAANGNWKGRIVNVYQDKQSANLLDVIFQHVLAER